MDLLKKDLLQEKDLLKDIISNILQEIGLFATYLRLRKEEDINIEFNVEYSGDNYLGFTEVDKNGRRSIVLNLGRNEVRYGPQFESKIRGVILHEEAHNFFSPMSPSKDLPNLLTRLSQEFPELDSRIIKYVVHIVEDHRVEYLFKGEYPGSVRNFSDIYTAVLDEFAMRYNPNSILHLLFLARMATATEHTKTSDFEQVIPSKLKNMYYEFIKNIEETTGKGFDSTEIAARKILEKIKDYVKEDKGNNSGTELNNLENKGNNSGTELNNLEKLPKLFGGYVRDRISTNLPPYIKETLNKAKREQENKAKIEQDQQLKKNLEFAKRGSSELRSSQPHLQRGQVNGYYSYDLRKTLEEYYSGSRLETTKSLLGGRLNERKIMDHLVRREQLIGPNVKLYEIRRSSVRGTDLFVLVDTSVSMKEDLKRVKKALRALVETTKGSRSITTHFFGFPGASGYLYDIKPNEVNSISISGGTPLAHALEELQGEMKRGFSSSQGRNYLLFILTDGEPDDLELANMQLRKMKEAGIEVIVILTDNPTEITKDKFAESRVVYLYSSKSIAMRRFLQELNRELLEAFMDKKIEKQKMY